MLRSILALLLCILSGCQDKKEVSEAEELERMVNLENQKAQQSIAEAEEKSKITKKE
jgi:hypothetical protein